MIRRGKKGRHWARVFGVVFEGNVGQWLYLNSVGGKVAYLGF
jgi:hypothetical protein